MAICKFCGKEFLSDNPRKIYCSLVCHDKAYAERKRKMREEERKKENRVKNCLFCGKEFVYSRITQRFCRNECYERYRKENKKKVPISDDLQALINSEKEKYSLEVENKIIAQRIKQQSILEYSIDQIKDVLKIIPPPKPINLKTQDRFKAQEAVLLISDCQIGEEVVGEEIHDLGKYNFEIFKQRMERIANAVVDITDMHRKLHRLDVLNIAFLGDIVNGELIFEGQQLYNQLDLLEQVFLGVYFVANVISSLSAHFKQVKILGVPGNHGRIGKKGQTKPHVNFDLFFYKILEIILKDHKNISCYFPKRFFAIKKIMGHTFFFAHGDNIHSYYRTPFYGMEDAATKYQALLSRLRVYLDYVVVGHFHREGNFQLPFGEMVVNGSFVGPNVHSVRHLKTGVSPTQLFFGVNEKYGITWRYVLSLEENKEEIYEYVQEIIEGKNE